MKLLVGSDSFAVVGRAIVLFALMGCNTGSFGLGKRSWVLVTGRWGPGSVSWGSGIGCRCSRASGPRWGWRSGWSPSQRLASSALLLLHWRTRAQRKL